MDRIKFHRELGCLVFSNMGKGATHDDLHYMYFELEMMCFNLMKSFLDTGSELGGLIESMDKGYQ